MARSHQLQCGHECICHFFPDTSHIYGLQKNVTFPKVRVDDDVAGSMTSRLSSADVMTPKASSSLQKLTIPISVRFISVSETKSLVIYLVF